MKLSRQLLLIVFIGLLLLFAKDDVARALTRLQAYLSHTSYAPSLSTTGQQVNVAPDKIAQPIQDIVTTPGALKKISDNLLVNSSSDTTLSLKKVISFTNKARKDNGDLKPLIENSMLDFSAEKKLEDLFREQYFEHISPKGVGVADLGRDAGYDYIIIGENLALGNFKDDASLVEAWMESPGHRANILNRQYTDIGVAVGRGIYKGQETWIAVQHFGLPKSSCPTIDAILHGQIDVAQKEIKNMESDLALRRTQIDSGAVYNGKTTNEQIDEYNALVPQFNQLILDTKEKINIYNTEVQAFNSCIKISTSGTEGSTQ